MDSGERGMVNTGKETNIYLLKPLCFSMSIYCFERGDRNDRLIDRQENLDRDKGWQSRTEDVNTLYKA